MSLPPSSPWSYVVGYAAALLDADATAALQEARQSWLRVVGWLYKCDPVRHIDQLNDADLRALRDLRREEALAALPTAVRAALSLIPAEVSQ
jgi:hypothetical protein